MIYIDYKKQNGTHIFSLKEHRRRIFFSLDGEFRGKARVEFYENNDEDKIEEVKEIDYKNFGLASRDYQYLFFSYAYRFRFFISQQALQKISFEHKNR